LSRTHILHVIQELRFGGAERVLAALCSGARAVGHRVSVAAAPGELGDEIDAQQFPMPMLGRRISKIPAGVAAVRHALSASQADIVHCHNPGVALITSLATRRGRRPPGLVTMHGVPDGDYPRAAKALRLAGLPTIACGPGVAQALEDEGLRVRDTIVNGITAPPTPTDRAALEEELGISRTAPLLVSVGRLVVQKNHSLALHALRSIPGAMLLIVGDGPLRQQLELESTRLGVRDRVVFAGVRPDARAIIGSADALVLVSRWEGLPLVALEALAAGTPVVATAVRGVRELLKDGHDSLLVAPGDDSAVARAVTRLLDDGSLAARLTREGLTSVGLYSEKQMVERYLRAYDALAT
jgi:glycosyltransferase involved in cell wall biosynthesis